MILMGLQKLTLLDYPGKMAATVFTGGCNFRCPFCHNASLVISDRLEPTVTEQELFEFLDKRRGILEGVCITGGEPTLMPDLLEFMSKIKQKGYLVKLDTNGYKPEVLEKILELGLADYVAMDIKNSPEKYAKTVGLENFDIQKINKSIDLLKNSGTPFEFRTTLVKDYHDMQDIEKIGRWLGPVENMFLQSFKDSGELICENLVGFNENEMKSLLNVLKPLVPSAKLRGI